MINRRRLLLVLSATLCVASTAFAQTLPQSVTKDRGVVSVDPVQFVDGRLVLRVVAFNKTSAPATLASEQIKIATAKGAEVKIVPLQKLIDDVKANSRGSAANAAHQASNYSRPETPRSNTGGLDVTAYSGANEAIDRGISSRGTRQSDDHVDEATRKQIEALQAGILVSAAVDPGKAAGGQVVSSKIKFSRKEEKAVRVSVQFSDETYEFNVPLDSYH